MTSALHDVGDQSSGAMWKRRFITTGKVESTQTLSHNSILKYVSLYLCDMILLIASSITEPMGG